MNSVVVSVFITAGAGVWMFTKLQKYSGNNTRQSAGAAGAASILILIVLLYVMGKLLG